MSLFKTLFALGLTLTAFSNVASAGVFIEPSIGYRSHTLKTTDLLMTTTEIKMSTPVYGLKFGYRSMMGIDVNLAYDYSSGKAEISGPAEKNDFTQSTGSVQLGVSALGALKIYLGYGLLNELKIAGLDKDATMITLQDFSGQTPVYNDPTSPAGKPSIAQYIKKILMVSDNDAFNRLYEFLGQEYINTELQKRGYGDVQILHRMGIFLTEECLKK